MTQPQNNRNSTPILNTVLYVYVILSVFYILPSGLPQPADYLIAIFLIPTLVFILNQHVKEISAPFLYGGLFTLLVIFINGLHFLFSKSLGLVFPILIYIYNFCLFGFIIYIFIRNTTRLLSGLYWALTISIILEFLYIILLGSGFGGEEGTFNNPNQLAYWCVLVGAILLVLKRARGLSLFDMGLWAMILYMELATSSRAGAGIMALMSCVLLFHPMLAPVKKLVALCGVILILITMSLYPNPTRLVPGQAIQNLMTKTIDRAEADRSRGFEKVINNPEQLIFGAGEGAWGRFNDYKEIHSGPVTILFSFGILGFILFSLFLGSIVWRGPTLHVILLFLILLYGLTHHGFRNSMFWVFLGVSYGVSRVERSYVSNAPAISEARPQSRT